ncbi:MAG: TIR-like domain-containing protein [Elusimicrobia bacterium GWA2_64_40]|nr:MAG: TIR-like domain-containing protein [Elusimicrobia bacterium GWA2_64_40]
MARRTFFSFRYRQDNWRAGIVRNSWVTQGVDGAGFFDSAAWEDVKKKDDSAIGRWIDNQLDGTSVTVILIGADTAQKKWIDYEMLASRKKGNGLLGIRIHQLKDKDGRTSSYGENPFDYWEIPWHGGKVRLSSIYTTYDWVDDDGYNNLGDWIEKAAKDAGK